MSLHLFAGLRYPSCFSTLAAAAFFCPVPILIFSFLQTECLLTLLEELPLAKMGMLLAKWWQNWFTLRERSRKPRTLRSLSNSPLASFLLSTWDPSCQNQGFIITGEASTSETTRLTTERLDAAGAAGTFTLLHSGH